MDLKYSKVSKASKRRMYRSNRNLAVVRLLLQLRSYDDDYPEGLFSMRRSYFVKLLYRVLSVFM